MESMSSSGQKDRSIILRAPVLGKGTTATPKKTYPTDTHTVWARLIPASGTERNSNQREISIQDLMFEAYYLSDVQATYELEFDSRKYNIISVVPIGRNWEMRIVARLSK